MQTDVHLLGVLACKCRKSTSLSLSAGAPTALSTWLIQRAPGLLPVTLKASLQLQRMIGSLSATCRVNWVAVQPIWPHARLVLGEQRRLAGPAGSAQRTSSCGCPPACMGCLLASPSLLEAAAAHGLLCMLPIFFQLTLLNTQCATKCHEMPPASASDSCRCKAVPSVPPPPC